MKFWQPENVAASTFAKIFIVALIVFAGFLYIRNLWHGSATIVLSGENFSAEVMTTAAQKNQGLSGRDSLGKNQAMLFVFSEPGLYDFWMKDMKFAIDIIWVGQGKIVDLAPRVAPAVTDDPTMIPRLTPRLPAERVIEVVAGTADRLHLKIGDAVKIIE